jgi:predicted transport protein
MPIFEINHNEIRKIKPGEFKNEKDLQQLIEKNLKVIFNCKLIASEFPTGNIHSGRIDTLALSEENNPVIIEYKKHASSDLINQSLYYLHWIRDHKGDFQVAVNKILGESINIDWSEIRVICIAPEYKKYDLHAVQVMGANIELWQYKIYENGILNIEEVYRRAEALIHANESELSNGKNPIMVEAGKKAAITRKTGQYTVEQHLEKLNKELLDLFNEVRDFITNLNSSIEETPKKHYIAYKTTQNFVCLETRKNKLTLFLKMNPKEIIPLPLQGRDVSNIGHFGTGDFELVIKSLKDFEETKYLIKDSLKNIGG